MLQSIISKFEYTINNLQHETREEGGHSVIEPNVNFKY